MRRDWIVLRLVAVEPREGDMARINEWEKEIEDALRTEHWSLTGPKQIVKVLAGLNRSELEIGGYITVGSSILGLPPSRLAAALGLPASDFVHGATVYKLARLPNITEYEYELTANYPGGLAYNPALHDPKYQPGSAKIHQWRIKRGILIPVRPGSRLELSPGKSVTYDWLMS